MNHLDQWIAIYRDGLLEDTLPFWSRRIGDPQYGGFLTALDRDGTLVDTDKSMWQQGRATWLFSRLYNEVEPRPEWLALAKLGIRFLDEHGFDPIDGRMWFHVDRAGRPLRKRRYAFTESFAAIAYGEYSRATGDLSYARKAEAAFYRFVNHQLDPQGVTPKFTDQRPMTGLGFPMITIITAQELRDSIQFLAAETWIDRSIAAIRDLHMNASLQCVLENVGPNGEFLDHFDGRLLNPGHAIEGAWFILAEGHRRQDPGLIQTGCQMLDWSWQRGWDTEFGGILYFVDARELPVQEYWHDMKFWWPQNEAIIATLLAYRLTGDDKYSRWHQQIHDWAYAHFPDPEYGEWFGYLHRDGRISSRLKGNLWKGPFHLPRMQLLCWKFLEAMQAEGH